MTVEVQVLFEEVVPFIVSGMIRHGIIIFGCAYIIDFLKKVDTSMFA